MLNDPSSRTRARLMREALVDAKVGLSQSRAARDAASAQLERERTELATVRRRGQLAAGINDAETVTLAAEFERKHSERSSSDSRAAWIPPLLLNVVRRKNRSTPIARTSPSSIRSGAPRIVLRATPTRRPVWRI